MAVELISGYSCLTLTNEASAPALACLTYAAAAQLGFNGEEQDAIELGSKKRRRMSSSTLARTGQPFSGYLPPYRLGRNLHPRSGHAL